MGLFKVVVDAVGKTTQEMLDKKYYSMGYDAGLSGRQRLICTNREKQSWYNKGYDDGQRERHVNQLSGR